MVMRMGRGALMKTTTGTPRLRNLLLLLVLLAVQAAVAFAVGMQAYSRAVDQSIRTGTGTLRLASAALDGYLERFAALPTLISEQEIVRGALLQAGNPSLLRAADEYLKSIANLLDASDVYILRLDGETIAASNFDGPTSFVGGNFRYRPYFHEASQGRLGRFFGLGVTSNKRGYYFSAPVTVGTGLLGIVVFKIDLDALEASWATGDLEILVVDPEGIVFMAGRPEWRFRTYVPLGPEQLALTHEIRRYADRDLVDLGIRFGQDRDGHPTASIAPPGEAEARRYAILSEPRPDAGWTVKVLVDLAPAAAQGVAVGAATFFLLALGAVLLAVARQRKLRLAERLRTQAEAREELERRVAERTVALGHANRRLETEVTERRATEETLRRTQSDLVEAGKLAALGQMSAALSHEFNQPLAAASAYADSAVVLLDRGRTDEARENIRRIGSLVDRLSSISKHLRTFARRPEDRLQDVDVEAAVADALDIVGRRVETAGASIVIRVDPDAALVRAVGVRLQQILVNLISNAADAVEGRPVRRILVTATVLPDDRVRLAVADTGPGVPGAIGPRIFDPFFTTKGVGKGLGLGLSISYNIARDFGGTLRLEEGEGDGAVFALILSSARARALMEAAQ